MCIRFAAVKLAIQSWFFNSTVTIC